MSVLIFVYMAMTLGMGTVALWNGEIYPGISGIVGPMLCWVAASGLKGSIMVGTNAQKLAGLGLAAAFFSVGSGVVYHSGYWVEIFGYRLTGFSWCVVGFVCGWIGTTRKHAAT